MKITQQSIIIIGLGIGLGYLLFHPASPLKTSRPGLDPGAPPAPLPTVYDPGPDYTMQSGGAGMTGWYRPARPPMNMSL